MSAAYVRQVIHEFNEHGFGALDPKWSSGPTPRIDAATRERICRVARCQPVELGFAVTTWSLAKLADYLVKHRVVDRISREHLRQILHDHGVRWQATKTWKASTDPDFATKKDRILDLLLNGAPKVGPRGHAGRRWPFLDPCQSCGREEVVKV